MMLVKAQERFKSLSVEIPQIEKRLIELQVELQSKVSILQTATEEYEDMKNRLQNNQEKIIGLGFRCLNRNLTSYVLSFLSDNSPEILACKYWYSLRKKIRSKPV